MNEEEVQKIVNTTLQTQAQNQAQIQSATPSGVANQETLPADIEKLEAEAQSKQEFEELQRDYMLVVCDYLPNILYTNLVIVGALAFALVYKILKQHFSHLS